MAHRTRSRRSSRPTYRARARVSYARGSGRRRTARRSTARSGRARGGTVRIVIEQPGANPIARPQIGMVQAGPPQKAMF